jgi:hypothetical protein
MSVYRIGGTLAAVLFLAAVLCIALAYIGTDQLNLGVPLTTLVAVSVALVALCAGIGILWGFFRSIFN